MSSPTFDIPEHLPLVLNADGTCPVEPGNEEEEKHAHVVCWCGDNSSGYLLYTCYMAWAEYGAV